MKIKTYILSEDFVSALVGPFPSATAARKHIKETKAVVPDIGSTFKIIQPDAAMIEKFKKDGQLYTPEADLKFLKEAVQ